MGKNVNKVLASIPFRTRSDSRTVLVFPYFLTGSKTGVNALMFFAGYAKPIMGSRWVSQELNPSYKTPRCLLCA